MRRFCFTSITADCGIKFLRDILKSLDASLEELFGAMLLSQQIVYWISLFHELAIIKDGREVAVWGIDKWRCHNPLSDTLLVY